MLSRARADIPEHTRASLHGAEFGLKPWPSAKVRPGGVRGNGKDKGQAVLRASAAWKRPATGAVVASAPSSPEERLCAPVPRPLRRTGDTSPRHVPAGPAGFRRRRGRFTMQAGPSECASGSPSHAGAAASPGVAMRLPNRLQQAQATRHCHVSEHVKSTEPRPLREGTAPGADPQDIPKG